MLGFFVPFVLVLGATGNNVQLSLYGLETNEAFSSTGMIVSVLFIIKGITAFGLLKEKHWAIKMGIIDAIIGIFICTLIMLYPLVNSGANISFRLELILLIPYLLRLLKIKTEWES